MVAVHEAAHAVASYDLEKGETQIQVITIQKREGALGLVSRQEIEDMYLATQRQMLARIQVSLAGLVAEEIWFGQTTSGPSTDLEAATYAAAAYVGIYGMGKTLHSATVMANPYMGGNPIQATLTDPGRREEVDALLSDARTQVRVLLTRKRPVVEGVKDALLEREELIGDEIEQLMADLGEREPLDVALPGSLSGNGQQALPGGDGDGRLPQEPEDVTPPFEP